MASYQPRTTTAFGSSRRQYSLLLSAGVEVVRLATRAGCTRTARFSGGAQSGHSRLFPRFPDHPELPAVLSAPAPTRTGDLQVRSLRPVVTRAISPHPSPVRPRHASSRRGVRWARMGWVWAQSGHSGSPNSELSRRAALFVFSSAPAPFDHTKGCRAHPARYNTIRRGVPSARRPEHGNLPVKARCNGPYQ
jgi:hypothetical protein